MCVCMLSINSWMSASLILDPASFPMSLKGVSTIPRCFLLICHDSLVPVVIPSLISYDKLNSSFAEIICVDSNKTLHVLPAEQVTIYTKSCHLHSKQSEKRVFFSSRLLHHFMTYYGHDGLSCPSIYTFIHAPLIPPVCPDLQQHCVCWWSSLEAIKCVYNLPTVVHYNIECTDTISKSWRFQITKCQCMLNSVVKPIVNILFRANSQQHNTLHP